MKIKNIFKVYIGFILILFSISNLNATEKNYYQDIVNDWNKIFPDKNRNAAGPKFFKYILDKEITYKDFVEYNKLYCAVSGSLISPNSTPEFVYLKENITEKKICGEYYRCCIPCSCDLMKYSKTQKMKYKFTDIEKEFYVLTIDNPCGKKDFPIQVNKNYFCNGNVLDKSQVSVLDNKLVIGYLHESRPCLSTDLDYINTHQVTGKFCDLRNNTPLDQLKSGMGDIFIKLAR